MRAYSHAKLDQHLCCLCRTSTSEVIPPFPTTLIKCNLPATSPHVPVCRHQKRRTGYRLSFRCRLCHYGQSPALASDQPGRRSHCTTFWHLAFVSGLENRSKCAGIHLSAPELQSESHSSAIASNCVCRHRKTFSTIITRSSFLMPSPTHFAFTLSPAGL